MSALTQRQRLRRWRQNHSRRVRRWFGRQDWIARVAIFVTGAAMLAAIGKLVPDAIERWTVDDTPFLVTAEANPDRLQINGVVAGASYVTEEAVDEVGQPPGSRDDCVGRFAWAKTYDAVQADFSMVRIRVEATGDEDVFVTGIDVVVDDREPPLSGTHLACPGQGADIPEHTVSVDLSSERPTVVVENEDGTPVDSVHFLVRKGEPEAFMTVVDTPTCDCRWHVELRLEVNGDEHVEIVDDGGQPFRSTSTRDAVPYRWTNGAWTMLNAIGTEPPPPLGECPYVGVDEVEAASGARWQLRSVQPIEGYGDPPELETICTFLPVDDPDNPVPPYISITMLSLHHEQRAATRFDELVTSYRQIAPATELRGLGDEAYSLGGVVLAEQGTEVLLVEADGVVEANEVARDLAMTAAARAWG